jgi:hypothetical protein
VAQRTTTRKTGKKNRSGGRTAARSAKAASRTARSAKPAAAKRGTTRRPGKAAARGKHRGGEDVTIDRRRAPARRQADAQPAAQPAVTLPKLERRKKVNRRRQIDPTTCERDYSCDEVEFMNAIDDYKRKSGRMFPTCSEVLEVVRGLGYVKRSPAELAAEHGIGPTACDDTGPEQEQGIGTERVALEGADPLTGDSTQPSN